MSLHKSTREFPATDENMRSYHNQYTAKNEKRMAVEKDVKLGHIAINAIRDSFGDSNSDEALAAAQKHDDKIGFKASVRELSSAIDQEKLALFDGTENYSAHKATYQEAAASEARADLAEKGVDLNFEMSHRDQASFVADHAEADEAARAAAENIPQQQ